MQPILLILLTLAIVGTLLLLLRHRWHRLGWRTRRLILGSGALAMAIFLCGYATHCTTRFTRLNAAIYWGAIAGYLLLLTIHSLTRPRWLTVATAIILAAPVLSSSLILPLGGLFYPRPRRIEFLGDQVYASWQEFEESGAASSGTDIEVFYRPPLLPFLEHARLGGRFYNVRCNGAATEIVLQPDSKSVYVRCPPWPGSGQRNNGEYLPLH